MALYFIDRRLDLDYGMNMIVTLTLPRVKIKRFSWEFYKMAKIWVKMLKIMKTLNNLCYWSLTIEIKLFSVDDIPDSTWNHTWYYLGVYFSEFLYINYENKCQKVKGLRLAFVINLWFDNNWNKVKIKLFNGSNCRLITKATFRNIIAKFNSICGTIRNNLQRKTRKGT